MIWSGGNQIMGGSINGCKTKRVAYDSYIDN